VFNGPILKAFITVKTLGALPFPVIFPASGELASRFPRLNQRAKSKTHRMKYFLKYFN
jgi:hypothetical protein